MQVQLDIGFDELVQIAKKLPARQWTKLKQAVEKQDNGASQTFELENFLLNAPTFSKRQLEQIENTRKEINQWRTK